MSRSASRWGSAGLFILLGIVLLLFTTDAVEGVDFWTWFPAFFVLLGAWAIVQSRGRNLTGPVLVIVVAGAYLLRNLDYLPDDFIGTWWPAVFVLLGVLILLNRSRRPGGTFSASTDSFTSISIFGGDRKRIGSDTFTGGEIIAVFGGPTIDLRETSVENPPAVLDFVTIFGGATVRVPEEWTVKTETLAIFGSVSDKRATAGHADTADLVLEGVSLFGGVKITD